MKNPGRRRSRADRLFTNLGATSATEKNNEKNREKQKPLPHGRGSDQTKGRCRKGKSLGQAAHAGEPLFLFAGGGTGGHLFPALAVAAELRERVPNAQFLFAGTTRPIDQEIIGPSGFELFQQSLPTLSIAPWRWPRIMLGLRRARMACRALLRDRKPVAVIGTGGMASVPAICEAASAGMPTVLLNPDAIPGRANRYLARVCDLIFVQWEESCSSFARSKQMKVVGCAVRKAFHSASREEGVSQFKLDPTLRTLLVTGASLGARTINQAILAIMPALESAEGWQVLHLTGEADFDVVQEAYCGSTIPSVVQPFTQHMPEAMAAADVVLARAGASLLAEITAVGLPAVLMPYPYHRDMHQLANARCLERVSAARIVVDRKDPALNGPELLKALLPLMEDEDVRRACGAAARSIGRPAAASTIADEVLRLAGLGSA